MVWTYSSTRKLARLLKSLERRQKKLVDSYSKQVEEIAKNPKAGSKLVGDLSDYYSWDWMLNKVSLRICYKLIDSDKHFHLVYFGTRENFYKELKNYIG